MPLLLCVAVCERWRPFSLPRQRWPPLPRNPLLGHTRFGCDRALSFGSQALCRVAPLAAPKNIGRAQPEVLITALTCGKKHPSQPRLQSQSFVCWIAPCLRFMGSVICVVMRSCGSVAIYDLPVCLLWHMAFSSSVKWSGFALVLFSALGCTHVCALAWYGGRCMGKPLEYIPPWDLLLQPWGIL